MHSFGCFEHNHPLDYLPRADNWIVGFVGRFYVGTEPISKFMFFELYRQSHVTGPFFRECPLTNDLLGVLNGLVGHFEFKCLFAPSGLKKAQCNEDENSSHVCRILRLICAHRRGCRDVEMKLEGLCRLVRHDLFALGFSRVEEHRIASRNGESIE